MEGTTQTTSEAVLLYEPWPCACSALNPPSSYICVQCSAVSEEAKQAIISRPPYIYKSSHYMEEEKGALEYCALCGDATPMGSGICESCRGGVGMQVDERVPKPAVPENAIRPWKCENCEAENLNESNCRQCSMIRQLPKPSK